METIWKWNSEFFMSTTESYRKCNPESILTQMKLAFWPTIWVIYIKRMGYKNEWRIDMQKQKQKHKQKEKKSSVKVKVTLSLWSLPLHITFCSLHLYNGKFIIGLNENISEMETKPSCVHFIVMITLGLVWLSLSKCECAPMSKVMKYTVLSALLKHSI